MSLHAPVRRTLVRRVLITTLWVAAVTLIAVSINVVGIQLVGDLSGWTRWLEDHRWEFFAWRVCLYGVTVWGWWWMRRRVREREPARLTRTRLWRTEAAAILAVLLLEGSVMLR